MTLALIALTAVLAYATFFAYALLAPWWTTRAGRAYFALFAALIILCTHFVAEAIFGQSSVWVENLVILLLAGAIAFNLGTILYKQWHFRGKDKP